MPSAQARRHGGALEGQAPPVTGGAPPDEDEKFTVKHWSRWKIHLIIYGFHVSASSKQNPKPIAILTIRNFFCQNDDVL